MADERQQFTDPHDFPDEVVVEEESGKIPSPERLEVLKGHFLAERPEHERGVFFATSNETDQRLATVHGIARVTVCCDRIRACDAFRAWLGER